jgi:hypothetical protein
MKGDRLTYEEGKVLTTTNTGYVFDKSAKEAMPFSFEDHSGVGAVLLVGIIVEQRPEMRPWTGGYIGDIHHLYFTSEEDAVWARLIIGDL